MPFTRPTLTELVTRIEADLVSRLQITSPVLRRALVRIIARAAAGGMHGIHGHVEWGARQIFASTADAENLDNHGAELGVVRRAATFATGSVTFTGTNSTAIPAGTRVQRSDGVAYETTAAGAIVAGSKTVAVRALAAGADGNAAVGVAVTLTSPIAGLQSAATVAVGGLTGGVDTESDEEYRESILSRKRNPPQGGAAADYIKWAKELAGVTRVWVYPNHLGPGTVGVTFVMDGLPNIIPTAPVVAAVQAYIDDPTRKPLCASVDVFAPVPLTMNVTLHVTPDTAEVRAAVVAELEDLLVREAEPGASILLSHLHEAISAAAGEVDHTLLNPVSDVTHGPSQLAILGTVTFA